MENNRLFPDGEIMDEWFFDTKIPTIEELGSAYVATEYGVTDGGETQTEKLQALIDLAAKNGGGVIVIPQGTYKTGALFFKQGVHLYVSKGAILLGSDDIYDYPVMETRIEGESCKYFPAIINADGVDGFTLFGEGTIDGNGLRAWKAFWLRREWNPACTNKDEQRARLVFISNSTNVVVAGLRMQNSQFWTNHIYKCNRVKFIGCDVYSPHAPVIAPSTDGLDIDACTDVLVKNCRFEVSDDAIALKGGKGPWADTLPENGANERILIEDCEFGPCCAIVTCGSECIHSKNVLIRNVKADGPGFALWLKMRPDTPQLYERITMENVTGFVGGVLFVRPWMQFFDLKGREDIPLSHAKNITIKDSEFRCHCFFDVEADKSQYLLSDIRFENLKITTPYEGINEKNSEGVTFTDVAVTLVDKL